jgi:predicted permease
MGRGSRRASTFGKMGAGGTSVSDLRFAWRMLARSRGFTLAAAGLLAAGIGVTTFIFSAVDAIILRPLPVAHPEQLVHFVQSLPRIGFDSRVPLPAYEALRDRSTTMSAVFGEQEVDRTMTEPAPAERVRIHLSTPNYFDDLGVHAVVGRTLTRDDANDNPSDPPAVLSYSFWQRRYNGDSKALGKTLRVLGQAFVIVGVLPREFNGFTADTAPDIRVPLRVWPLFAPGWVGHPEFVELNLAGRLKPGVSIAKAQAESKGIWKAALDAMGKPTSTSRDPTYPLELAPLEHGTSVLRDRFSAALKFLIVCSGFLLLMVCANVAGLLLARSAARRREIAVRMAMGATRTRLVRQMLAESALLAALGAAGGILLAAAMTPILSRLLPTIHDLGSNRLALSVGLAVDRRVLLFALAVSIATVVLFGLAPAIAASRTSLDSILREARSSRVWRGRQALILVQVALCTALLTGAGLLIRTFDDLRYLNTGYDTDHVVTLTIDPPVLYTPGESIESYQKATRAFLDGLQQRIRETPGVVSVALAEKGVLRDRGMGTTIAPAGQRATPADVLAIASNYVTPDYFETMGIRLLAGRLLSGSFFDPPQKPAQAVVNQAFVERYFPGADAIGKRFGFTAPGELARPDAEIIGVVSDAKYRSLREPIQPTLYQLSYWEGAVVVPVRTRVKPELMIQPLRRAIMAFDPAVPIIEVETLADEVTASASGERLTAALGSIFALLAVLLSAAGIYGLLAYTVAQRRREIGIRVALGATPGDVGELIGRQALTVVIGGVSLGVAAARMAATLIASLLYGVAPGDFRSVSQAAIVVLAMAAIAAAIPAWRAAHIDPAIALRQDH